MTKIDDRVEAFAVEAGWVVSRRDDALRLGTSETALVVRRDQGGVRVEQLERGVVEGVDLATASIDLLERFLVQRIGLDWRSRRGLGHVAAPSPADLPEGASLVENPDGTATLGTRVGEAWLESTYDARRLGRTATVDLDTVIESFKDPAGRPLFDLA